MDILRFHPQQQKIVVFGVLATSAVERKSEMDCMSSEAPYQLEAKDLALWGQQKLAHVGTMIAYNESAKKSILDLESG